MRRACSACRTCQSCHRPSRSSASQNCRTWSPMGRSCAGRCRKDRTQRTANGAAFGRISCPLRRNSANCWSDDSSSRMGSCEPRSNLHASDSALMIGVASLPKPPAAETGSRLIRLPAAFPQVSRVLPWLKGTTRGLCRRPSCRDNEPAGAWVDRRSRQVGVGRSGKNRVPAIQR
jgi:hypothetical protein